MILILIIIIIIFFSDTDNSNKVSLDFYYLLIKQKIDMFQISHQNLTIKILILENIE